MSTQAPGTLERVSCDRFYSERMLSMWLRSPRAVVKSLATPGIIWTSVAMALPEPSSVFRVPVKPESSVDMAFEMVVS